MEPDAEDAGPGAAELGGAAAPVLPVVGGVAEAVEEGAGDEVVVLPDR